MLTKYFNLSRAISVHSISAFINIISKQVSYLVTIIVMLKVLYIHHGLLYIRLFMFAAFQVCGLFGAAFLVRAFLVCGLFGPVPQQTPQCEEITDNKHMKHNRLCSKRVKQQIIYKSLIIIQNNNNFNSKLCVNTPVDGTSSIQPMVKSK